MNEQPLKELLRQADAGWRTPAPDVQKTARRVRNRLRRRMLHFRYGMAAAAAIIVAAGLTGQHHYEMRQKDRRIARLKQNIEDLNQRTEQTLAVVQELLERQQRQSGGPFMVHDPVKAEVEETAFILIYQAERMMEKYNNKEAAIEYYKQVVEHFSDTPSAQTARERLRETEKQPNFI